MERAPELPAVAIKTELPATAAGKGLAVAVIVAVKPSLAAIDAFMAFRCFWHENAGIEFGPLFISGSSGFKLVPEEGFEPRPRLMSPLLYLSYSGLTVFIAPNLARYYKSWSKKAASNFAVHWDQGVQSGGAVADPVTGS